MVKFWNVIEEKQFSDGSAATTSTPKTDLAHAESAYYDILKAAAISGLPYHAAYLLESNRGIVMSKYYDRSASNG